MSDWLSDNDLGDTVAARLGTTRTSLAADSAYWTTIISEANTEAYNYIRTKLLDRGYSVANIDAWDRRVEFNKKLGVCIAFENGAASKNYPLEAVDRICKCREELETVAIVVDDEVVSPESGGARVSYGDVDDGSDTFTSDMEI